MVSTTACVYDGNNDHYYMCVRRQQSTTACVYDGNNDHYYTCVRRQQSTTACVYNGNNDQYYTCVRREQKAISLWQLLQRDISTLLTATMASTNLLPANNKQKGRKDWSNDATFIAALDEWNSNRPVGDKGKLMPMTAFCKLRDIPYRTFLRHCKSDETKEAEKNQRRE